MADTKDNACDDWQNCTDEEKYKWLALKNGGDINTPYEDKSHWCTNYGVFEDKFFKNGEKPKEWCKNHINTCKKTCYLNFPNGFLKEPDEPKTVIPPGADAIPYSLGSSPYDAGASASASPYGASPYGASPYGASPYGASTYSASADSYSAGASASLDGTESTTSSSSDDRLKVVFDSNKNIDKLFNRKKSSTNDDKLKKYKNFLNKTGFVKMEINLDNLFENIIIKLDSMKKDKLFNEYHNEINELNNIFKNNLNETKKSTKTQSIASFNNTFRKGGAMNYSDFGLEMVLFLLKEGIYFYLNIISQMQIIFVDNKSNSNNSITFYISKVLLENDLNNMTELLDILNFEVDDKERRQFFKKINKLIPNQKIVISNIINILITLSINTLIPVLVLLKIYKKNININEEEIGDMILLELEKSELNIVKYISITNLEFLNQCFKDNSSKINLSDITELSLNILKGFLQVERNLSTNSRDLKESQDIKYKITDDISLFIITNILGNIQNKCIKLPEGMKKLIIFTPDICTAAAGAADDASTAAAGAAGDASTAAAGAGAADASTLFNTPTPCSGSVPEPKKNIGAIVVLAVLLLIALVSCGYLYFYKTPNEITQP